MFCKKCGYELQENASFCSKCGTKNNKDQEGKKPNIVAIVVIAVIVVIVVSLFICFLFFYSKNTQNERLIRNEDNISDNIEDKTEYANENVKVLDENGNTIIIPKGFKMLKSEGTTVQEGIVIQDIDGNEFVWIPVGEIKNADGSKSTIEFGRYDFNEDGTIKRKVIDESAILDRGFFERTTMLENDYDNTGAKDIYKFKESVNKNGGYYIARYESSYKDGILPYSRKSTSYTEEWGWSNGQFKEGMLWNNITQPEAAIAAKNMYNSDSLESDLMNSFAFDTALIFIRNSSGKPEYLTLKATSISSKLSNTGTNGDYICNIYDIAGNVSEWTTETLDEGSYSDMCTFRGSSLDPMYTTQFPDSYGNRNLCERAGAYGVGVGTPYIGFRVILYIK